MAEESGFVEWVKGTNQVLAARAADLEPGVFEPGALLGAIGELERLRRLAGVLTAKVAAEVVRRDAWRSSGARSPEAWYARVTGTSVGAAARTLGTLEKMAAQPEVDEAFRRGELSEQQAEKVAAATAEDPSAARRLVEQAKRGTARQLQEECDRTVAAKRRAEDEERRRRALHDRRYCRTWVDAEGAGRIDARLAPDALAQVRACLRPFEQAEFDQARRDGRREGSDAYRADALVAMARAAARPSPADGDGDGDGTAPGPGGADQAGGGGGGVPATVIAVVSHQALVRGRTEGGETCRLEGIGEVPVSTVHDMMTDAFLAAVVTDGTDIRSVTHLGRHATARQRTALLVRDPTCVVPGCDIRDGLEIDHVAEWSPTRVTRVDDLARLCKGHHRMKTYQGWALRGPPGRWRWEPPDAVGSTAPTDPARPDAAASSDREARPASRPPPNPPDRPRPATPADRPRRPGRRNQPADAAGRGGRNHQDRLFAGAGPPTT